MRRKCPTAAVLILALLCAAAPARAVTPGGSPVRTVPNETVPAPPATAFPMKVEDFVAGNFLRRSDVALTTRDWDLTAWIIRRATGSPFSHAALVFNLARQEPGIDDSFLIEAGTSGVDLTKLSDYLDDKSTYIAVKRFRQDWFDEQKQARVRGVLLDKIKASYNYWAIGRIVRAMWFGVQTSVEKKERTLDRYRDNAWTPPNEFICSGLVQIGFVETVLEYIRQGLLPPAALNEVVFRKEAEKWLPDAAGWRQLGTDAPDTAALFREQNLSELESVTPEDLAQSDKLEWLYFIKGGTVHKVSSYAEVKALLAEASAEKQTAPAPVGQAP